MVLDRDDQLNSMVFKRENNDAPDKTKIITLAVDTLSGSAIANMAVYSPSITSRR